MKIKIDYTDGTNRQEALGSISGVAAFEVYRFPAGYNQLQIGSFDGSKSVFSYTIWLEDQVGNVISELRTYVVNENDELTRNFIYQNSLGGWSSVTTFGNAEAKIKVSKDQLSRKLPVGFKYSDRQRVTTDVSGLISEKVYIGYLTNEERKHLVDFSISEQVYEVTAAGYLPVNVRFDYVLKDTFHRLQDVYMTVEFEEVRNYTPEL